MEKIIFLDIDGVLNHQNWYSYRHKEIDQNDIVSHYPFYEFDPKSIEQLNRIIEETGAKVVVSSTWRMGRTISQLQEILDRVGFVGEVIDTTPHFYVKGTDNEGEKIGYTIPRGCEIEWWLKNKGKFQRINWSTEEQQKFIDNAIVKNYVILDDDSDMLYGQREHFVKTYFMNGLTEERADECIKILKSTLIDLYYENYIPR
jgi:hypothetical protein